MLTDKNFEVLTLLRSHRDDEKGLAIMARHPYPMHTVGTRHLTILNPILLLEHSLITLEARPFPARCV